MFPKRISNWPVNLEKGSKSLIIRKMQIKIHRATSWPVFFFNGVSGNVGTLVCVGVLYNAELHVWICPAKKTKWKLRCSLRATLHSSQQPKCQSRHADYSGANGELKCGVHARLNGTRKKRGNSTLKITSACWECYTQWNKPIPMRKGPFYFMYVKHLEWSNM